MPDRAEPHASGWGPLDPALPEDQRSGRCEALHALACQLLGGEHPLVIALQAAVTDRAAIPSAVDEMRKLSTADFRLLAEAYDRAYRPQFTHDPRRGRRANERRSRPHAA